MNIDDMILISVDDHLVEPASRFDFGRHEQTRGGIAIGELAKQATA